MSRNHLLFLFFLISLPAQGHVGSILYSYLPGDTALAEKLFRTAERKQAKAEYDSAVYYYMLSADKYGQKKYLENYLRCRNNIITTRRKAGQTTGLFSEAFINLENSLRKPGVSGRTSADCYSILGNLYSDANNQDSSLYYFRKSLSVLENLPKTDQNRIAATCRNLAIVLIDKGLLDSASLYIHKSTRLFNSLYGPDHNELASNYNISGSIAYYLGRFDECSFFFRKIVKIREKNSGPDHPVTAEAYNNLAVLHYVRGNYDSALLLNRKALDIRVDRLPENHPDIALSLNNIGNVYLQTSKFELAAEYHRKALEIRKRIYKTDNSEIAMSYDNLGVLYLKMGQYSLALDYFLKYLNITEKIFGQDNPYTSDAYNNVGAAYSDLGDYGKSLLYLKKALEMRMKRGPFSPGISGSYNNLGSIYKFHGDYDLALSYFRNSIDVIRHLNGNNHPDLAGKYNNIGEIYAFKGNNDSALTYFNRAIDLSLKTLGKDDAGISSSYLNRGDLYLRTNESLKAINDFRNGLAVTKKAYGEIHPAVADFYKAISGFLMKKGSEDSSFFFQRKALLIKEKSLPANHPVLAAGYRSMGELQYEAGKNDSARIFYTKSLGANYTRTYPDKEFDASLVLDQNEFALTIFDLCRLDYSEYCNSGDQKLLIEIVDLYDFMKIFINTVISDFILEQTKIRLLNQLSEHTHAAVEAAEILYRRTGNPYYFDRALEYSELNKSSVLRNLDTRFKTDEKSTEHEKLVLERKNLLGYIYYLQMKIFKPETGKDGSASGEARYKIDSLMLRLREVNDTFNLLTVGSGNSVPVSRNSPTKRIRRKLGDQDVFISYFLSGPALYTFLISKDTSLLVRNSACPGDSIKRLVNEYVLALKRFEKEKIPYMSSALYRILLKDLEKIKGSKKNLIIIPDKDLFFLPFETLSGSIYPVREFSDFRNVPFLIRNYSVVYHYSADLWCSGKESKAGNKQGFLAFAPVFRQGSNTNSLFSSGGLSQKDIKFRYPFSNISLSLPELPYSLEEADSIGSMFRKYGIKTGLFILDEATEVNFKKNIDDYNIIHIATHGLMNRDHPEYSGLIFLPDSLFRQGVFLPEPDNDGILYASELYNLNIDAELVTLGACESGTGKLEDGEGIIGLVRGFLSAGTENVLSSFWKIDDRSTFIFMRNFYRSLLAGTGFSDALRKVKIEMISDPATSYPLLWGGFALIGHPRDNIQISR